MYSMVAFGPVLGFLLGAYMLSHHVDAFSGIPLPDDAGEYGSVVSLWVTSPVCEGGLVLSETDHSHNYELVFSC